MTQKIALVTGASRGLGAAIAEELSRTHHVVAVARTIGGLEDLDDRVQAHGGQTTLAPMDICNADAMGQLCRSIFDRWGGIDLWVHTAVHAAPLAPATLIDTKDFDKSVAVNISAFGTLITYVGALMREDAQAVIFDDPHAGEKFFGSYGATKAAQIALATSWANETASSGQKVHILTPAPMPTAVRGRFYPGEDRSPLADPSAEAKRLLSQIGLS